MSVLPRSKEQSLSIAFVLTQNILQTETKHDKQQYPIVRLDKGGWTWNSH